MARTPSPQQSAVYKWVRTGEGNLLLIAVAGAGKTTTILNASTMMGGDVAIAAYNKKIAMEIQAKLRAANVGKNVSAGTFHSFGLRAWSRACGAKRPEVKYDKVKTILEAQRCPEELLDFVGKLVSMAKNRAIGVLTPVNNLMAWHHMIQHYDLDSSLPDVNVESTDMLEEGISRAMSALSTSSEMDRDVIDFDDMLYAPLKHDARVWQNHWLLVDEAQDTNPARRALAKKMLMPGGRAIFVGDPAQAIYGFTGADNDSLEIIKREFACTELPLTVTFRCPKAVVDVARQYVSHITAHDSAPEGTVASITTEQFAKLPAEQLSSEAVMLCRTTAPLVSQAFAMIRRGLPCHVEGKEIGRGLVNLTRKWQTNVLSVFKDRLDSYRRREIEQFLAKGQEQKAEALSDKVDTLFVIMEDMPDDATVADLRQKIVNLFGDTPEGERPRHFTLSTVHKSKGREWQTVYILDRAKLMPSPYARQEWQREQERNLIYVAVTRSQNVLIDVVS